MSMEVLSSGSSELDFDKLEKMGECSESEMNRVLRTGKASSRSLDQTEFPAFDRLPATKVSPISDKELVNRVGEVAENTGIVPGSAVNSIDEVLELLAENNERLTDPTIPLPDELNALFAEDEPEADRRNFLIQVNQLVAEIMQLLSKLSDRDRGKTDHMKKEYNTLNNLAARSIEKKGEWTLGGAFLNLGLNIVAGVFGASGGIAQALGGVGQGFTGLFVSQNEATTSKYSNKVNLINTEMQNTASKSGDNSGWKNELIQSLNDVKEWMRASVRSNG